MNRFVRLGEEKEEGGDDGKGRVIGIRQCNRI